MSSPYLQSRKCEFTALASGAATPVNSCCREDAGVFVAPVAVRTAVYGCSAGLDAISGGFGVNAQVIVDTAEVAPRRLTCLGGTGSGSFVYTPPPGSGGVTVNIIASLTMDAAGVVSVAGSVVNLNGIAVGPLQGRVSTTFCPAASVVPAWTGTLTV